MAFLPPEDIASGQSDPTQEEATRAIGPPTSEPMIDGVPMNDFLVNERQANRRGETQQFTDEGTAFDPRDEKLSLIDVQDQGPDSLIDPVTRPKVDAGNANDSADIEMLLAQAGGYDVPKENRALNIQNGQGALEVNAPRTPENLTIDLAKKQVEEGYVTEFLGLDTIGELSGEEQFERLQFAVNFIDIRRATVEEMLAIAVIQQGVGGVTEEQFKGINEQYTFLEKESLRKQMMTEQTQLLRNSLNEFVADQGWDTWYEATADVAIQEMIPIYNVLSKVGFQEVFMRELNIEDGSRFFLGSRRNEIREALVALSVPERQAAVRNIIDEVRKLQSKEGWGNGLRMFNVLENFEAIFTEGVINGDDSADSFDLFFGNFESAAETLFSFISIMKIGKKGFRQVFRTADASTISKNARASGARQAGREANTRLTASLDALGEAGEVDDLAAARLARPEEFVDERTVDLPGVRKLTERLDRVEGKVLDASRGRLSRTLNEQEKEAVVNGVTDKLELGDSAVISPSMSVVKETPDGAIVRAVITKNGDEAWNNFDELLPDLLDMDPTLENLKVMRRGADGTIEHVEMTADELARIATFNAKGISDADLIARSGKTTNQIEFALLEREAARRAGASRSVDELIGDEFFLQYDHFRPWHPTDKVAFGGSSFRNTANSLVRMFLTPNAKFGDDIVGTFQDNYLSGARVNARMQQMFKPFYGLKPADKRAVEHMYEWGEDFAKENGKGPTLFDYHANFTDITEKQTLALVALRRGFDAQYEVFNRRLWLEFQGLGYQTARSTDASMPRFHGKNLNREDVAGQTVYDPVSGTEIKMSGAELDQLYLDSGSVMKIDIPIDVPGSNGARKVDMVLIDPDSYKVGDLSFRPLEYFDNYSYRFYEDPYYVVKRQRGGTLNGAARGADDYTEEAIKTAGSQLEGETFLGRIGTRTVDSNGRVIWKDSDGFEYDIVPARNIEQGDNVLKQKQSLHREGRLFWDSRNVDRLPDVNGNRAKVMDFTKSLERGAQLASRLNSEEDAIRSLKNAFEVDFGKVAGIKVGDMAIKDIGVIISDMQRTLRATTAPETKLRLQRAIEVAKYIRQMEGIESKAIPIFRSMLLKSAVWVERMGIPTGKVQKFAQNVDPIRAARSAAFYSFMVFRPVRQLLVQMSQPLFLTGIDPLYVLSGKGLTDSIALRIGHGRFINSAFDPGYSNKVLAKMMGLTSKEFKTLIKEFEKSGAIDVVDSHAFAGGSASFHRVATPDPGLINATTHKVKQGVVGVTSLARKGFDLGEGFNKLGTYNVAWRRVMKEKGYKSLTELTEADWAKVKIDTDNLSLAMTRPNNAPYQSGLLSVSTQFLSFTHKVAQAMLGANPALSKVETGKMWASMYVLFGANMFGARDYVRQNMIGLDLDIYLDQVIPDYPGIPNGTTVIDLLSGGLIQTLVNKTMEWTDDDWQAIDTENFTPVLNATQFYEMALEGVLALEPAALLGPFGNRATAALRAFDFAANTVEGLDNMDVADKFTLIAKHVTMELFPQFSDIVLAHLSYDLGRMYHKSGESLDLEPTWAAMVARGLVGAHTMEEVAFFRMQDSIQDSDKLTFALQRDIKRYLKQYHFLHQRGEISDDEYDDVVRIAGHLAGYAGEGRKWEVLKGAMLGSLDDDDPSESVIQLWAAGAESGALSASEAKDAIMQLIPPERQQELRLYIDEIFNEKQMNDEEMRRRTIESHPQ